MNTVEPELTGGEQLLWSGSPRSGVHFRRSDLAAIPLSLLWCVFAVFWEYSVIKSGASIFSIFIGLTIVMVGLYILIGRFIRDAVERRKISYWVTNQRAIISRTSGSKLVVTSLPYSSLSKVSLTERPDRSGSIQFDRKIQDRPFAEFNRLFVTIADSPNMFESVVNVRAVYDLIDKAKKNLYGHLH